MKKINNIVIVFLGLLFIVSSCSSDDNTIPTTTNTETTEQQKVFKEFWDIYDRHYPLMHRKSINWQTVYDT